MTSSLRKYDEKRDFQRTPEPPAKLKASAGPLTFVVQKHAARRLHYDFRIEVDGVLKSWAVPNGPSLNPADKRLAVQTEDHPLDYASFEGVIPRGEYGGGQVIVWDNGTYSPDEDGKLSFDNRAEAEARVRRELSDGKLSLFLRGRKLKGSWTLVKTRRGEKDWLLIKHEDELADRRTDILKEDRSVLSDLSIEDLKAGRLPDPARQTSAVARPEDLPGARPASFPRSPAPMLPTLADRPFSHPDWLFEPKFDGVRALALIRHGQVKLVSRRGLDPTLQYPSLCQDLARQPEGELILDGEIVALDEDGRPSFQRLQQRLNLTRERDIRRAEAQIPLHYFVFDLLYLQGFDLGGVPLDHRKALLQSVLVPSETVRLLDHFEAEGDAAFQAAVEHGLEGVVAKHRASAYEFGRRSRHWLKVKSTRSADFVVGGYTPGKGARSRTFGALALGYYDKHGQLIYAGNVGSGFDDRTLSEIRRRLDSLRMDACPFADKPQLEAGTTWVRPELVAEIKYGQWTQDGRLRAPVFLHLREDKTPGEATRETVAPVPTGDGSASDARGPTSDDVAHVLEQLEQHRDRFVLDVQSHKVPLTNLDKELWPPAGERRGLTKRDLIRYLAQASRCLLPHLRERPLTLTRYPDGIHSPRFWQKHWATQLPDFVQTVRLFSEHYHEDQDYLLCNNLPTLVWLGQLANLELHTWYARVDPAPDGGHLSTVFTGSEQNIDNSLLNHPDFMVFDLDPYIYSGRESKGDEPELNRKAFAKTCEAALWLKDLLDSLSLSSFVKTTGRTGLHIYVPIVRKLDHDAVRSACETICRFLLQRHPLDLTMEWTVTKRTGKIFLDHNQNVRGKTLASVYSPRPSPEAAVSIPVRWDELGEIFPTDFTVLTACQRIEKVGDLWADILDAKHDLAALLTATAAPS